MAAVAMSGTAIVVQWIVAGGTVTIQPNYTNASFNQTGEQADTTSGAATWDTHEVSRQNWEFSLEGFFDTAATGSTFGTADLAKLIVNTKGLIAIGPLGTATGKQKFGGSATVSKNEATMDFADPLKVSLSFKGNGQPYWNFGSAW